ncbi:MAG: hypothetical protein AB7S71_12210 [Dongiaceae bacterium]
MPQPVPIEIEIDGQIYTGTYTTDAAIDLITVSYGTKSQATQLGAAASAPEALARIMLRELIVGRRSP